MTVKIYISDLNAKDIVGPHLDHNVIREIITPKELPRWMCPIFNWIHNDYEFAYSANEGPLMYHLLTASSMGKIRNLGLKFRDAFIRSLDQGSTVDQGIIYALIEFAYLFQSSGYLIPALRATHQRYPTVYQDLKAALIRVEGNTERMRENQNG